MTMLPRWLYLSMFVWLQLQAGSPPCSFGPMVCRTRKWHPHGPRAARFFALWARPGSDCRSCRGFSRAAAGGAVLGEEMQQQWPQRLVGGRTIGAVILRGHEGVLALSVLASTACFLLFAVVSPAPPAHLSKSSMEALPLRRRTFRHPASRISSSCARSTPSPWRPHLEFWTASLSGAFELGRQADYGQSASTEPTAGRFLPCSLVPAIWPHPRWRESWPLSIRSFARQRSGDRYAGRLFSGSGE